MFFNLCKQILFIVIKVENLKKRIKKIHEKSRKQNFGCHRCGDSTENKKSITYRFEIEINSNVYALLT